MTSHRHRGRLVRTDENLLGITQYYERLYRFSLGARYHVAFEIESNDMEDLIDTDLSAVNHRIEYLLGSE